MPEATQLPASMRPAVLPAWQDCAKRLECLGAEIVPVRLPEWTFELDKAVGNIIASEAFALHRNWIENLKQPIGDPVRARIFNARALAPGEYAETLRVMAERRRLFSKWFQPFDALLLPGVAIPAPPLDEINEASPIPNSLTRPANYLGPCTLSMPAGLREGLPLGMQLVGKPFAERTVLEIRKAFQEDAGHHNLRPEGS